MNRASASDLRHVQSLTRLRVFAQAGRYYWHHFVGHDGREISSGPFLFQFLM